MSLKYFVANVLLCAAILLLGIKNYEAWNRSVELLPDASIAQEQPKIKNENLSVTASEKEPVSAQSYNLISEKNIFTPERKDFPIPAAAAARPIVRPQILLYGVTIAGDYESVTLVNQEGPSEKAKGKP